MNIMSIFLGFTTAAGGFLDISNIVFNPQAGAKFGFALLWPTVLGLIGIALYSEMCGRVAAISEKSVFDLVRQRMGTNIAFFTLIASLLLNVLTCAAEIGGVAIILRLLSGLAYHYTLAIAFAALLISTWFMPFKLIQWVYGFVGLLSGIFLINVFFLHLDWQKVLMGFVPTMPHLPQSSEYITYSYFIIGLLSATLMPYEVYFYSSGGIEEKWGEKELLTNRITSYLGYGIGAIFALAITIVSAALFFPRGIDPQLLSTAILGPIDTFGKSGLWIALIGLLAVIAGASVETALAGSYTISQFFGWRWGKHKKPSKTPYATISWIGMFVIAFLILLTGIDPIQLTQYAVVFSVVALPFTYLPILLVSNDKAELGKFVNGKVTTIIGWIYYVIILIIAFAAIPLLILSKGGNG